MKIMMKSLLGIAVIPAIAFAVTGMHHGTSKKLASGLSKGSSVIPFMPWHVTGPDANTRTCPVCKYGPLPAAQVWVNNDSASNIEAIAKNLDAEITKEGLTKFRAFVVFLQPKGVSDAAEKAKLSKMAASADLKNVALTFIPVSSDSLKDYKINPATDVKNTVMVYSQMKVVKNFVNFKADEANLSALDGAVATAVNQASNS